MGEQWGKGLMVMSKKMLEFQAPEYFQEFSCIGDRCENNCCHGWTIKLDKPTMKQYRANDRKYGTGIMKGVIVTDGGAGGHFRLNDDGGCPNLMDDGLCEIVGKMGPEALCATCEVYPRSAHRFSETGKVNLSMSLSCPEVVRLSILKNRPLQYQPFSGAVGRVGIGDFRLQQEEGTVSGELMQRVSQGMISIMQCQGVSFARRMTTLLLLASKADALGALHSEAGAEALLESIEYALANGQSETPELPVNYGYQFALLTDIVRRLVTTRPDNSNRELFYRVIDQSFAGIGLSDFNQVTQVHAEAYSTCQQYYVDPLLNAFPRVFENYIVHQLMYNAFPFGADNPDISVTERFLKIAILTMLLTGLMGGYAHYHERLTEVELTELIYMQQRVLTHNNHFHKSLLDICNHLGASDLAGLYTMFAR